MGCHGTMAGLHRMPGVGDILRRRVWEVEEGATNSGIEVAVE